jgi:hypothetical protein
MNWKTLSVCAILLFPTVVLAQQPPAQPPAAQQPAVVKGMKPITQTVTIQAIDQTSRLISVKTAKGTEEAIYAGPEVKRFSELKVGDTVQLTYYESTVYQLSKPGTPLSGSQAGATTGSGATLPGGTVARQTKATVEVTAVDMATPSITVRTADGRTVTRKVENKANIQNLKAGDRIDITYTEAMLVEVLPAKK